MIILITGASHTGKTKLAQRLLEKYHYPYLSIDHLKMGLIRSGQTNLCPTSPDSELTAYLWPIVKEMIKTALENHQNLIVEGCYIPFDWPKDFSLAQREEMQWYCLVFSSSYIQDHFKEILHYASVIEKRKEDEDCTLESVLQDNAYYLEQAKLHHLDYILIDKAYTIPIE